MLLVERVGREPWTDQDYAWHNKPACLGSLPFSLKLKVEEIMNNEEGAYLKVGLPVR